MLKAPAVVAAEPPGTVLELIVALTPVVLVLLAVIVDAEPAPANTKDNAAAEAAE
jgi:hypothetical protein